MTNGDRIKIEGIEYSVFIMGENIHGRGTVLCLTKIGKRGRPLKSWTRPALLRPDGEIALKPWD